MLRRVLPIAIPEVHGNGSGDGVSPPVLPLPRLSSVATGATADRVRDLLTEAILRGAFAPGGHLNAESLARQLGVSHIPVREALRSLHADGWVDMRPHAGAFVRERSEQELADLFELRVLVESRTAGLAAGRRTSAQLLTLETILEAQAKEHRPAELALVNEQFHNAVASCSHNAMICHTVASLGKRARFYYLTVAPQRREESLREHRLLTDAIRRRDVEAAEAIAREHVEHTRRDTRDHLRQE